MSDNRMPLDQAVRCVWDYHQMRHQLEPSDAILVLGSHDLRVGERAAELYHQKLAPLVVLSGGYGNFTRNVFSAPEADLLAGIVRNHGVPEHALVIENKSTNTGENVRFLREKLAAIGREIRTAIAVHKPYMERRTFATIRRQWPELQVRVTSPRLEFEDYCEGIGRDQVIHIMVGDLQRIMKYPALGFMEAQKIPAEVMAAFQTLTAAGYTQHLLPNECAPVNDHPL